MVEGLMDGMLRRSSSSPFAELYEDGSKFNRLSAASLPGGPPVRSIPLAVLLIYGATSVELPLMRKSLG